MVMMFKRSDCFVEIDENLYVLSVSLSLSSLSLKYLFLFNERDTQTKIQCTGHTVRRRIVSWCDHVSERVSLETSGDKDVDADREIRSG